MQTAQRLKVAALIVGLVLLAYGIRADNETARLAAIVAFVVGLALRLVTARKGNLPDDRADEPDAEN